MKKGDLVRYVGNRTNHHGFLFVVSVDRPVSEDQQWALFKSVATGKQVLIYNTDVEVVPDEAR